MDANMTTGLPSHVNLGSCSNSYRPTQHKGSGWFMTGEAILGVVMAPMTVCRCEEVIPNDLFGHYSLRKLEAASARQKDRECSAGRREANAKQRRTADAQRRGWRTHSAEDGGHTTQRTADAQRREAGTTQQQRSRHTAEKRTRKRT